MRVLAAYGPDDTLKLDRERMFVKSIFLLQIIHPDDLDAPEDAIIHDLEITDVSPSLPASPAPSHLPPNPTFPLHPVLSVFLGPRLLGLPRAPEDGQTGPQVTALP